MSTWFQLLSHLNDRGIAFDSVGADTIGIRFDFDDGRSERVIAKLVVLWSIQRCELTALLGASTGPDAKTLLGLNAELPCGCVCLIGDKYFLRHVLALEHTDGLSFEFHLREIAGRADAIERDIFAA